MLALLQALIRQLLMSWIAELCGNGGHCLQALDALAGLPTQLQPVVFHPLCCVFICLTPTACSLQGAVIAGPECPCLLI